MHYFALYKPFGYLSQFTSEKGAQGGGDLPPEEAAEIDAQSALGSGCCQGLTPGVVEEFVKFRALEPR